MLPPSACVTPHISEYLSSDQVFLFIIGRNRIGLVGSLYKKVSIKALEFLEGAGLI
jgi:hypothetical protein